MRQMKIRESLTSFNNTHWSHADLQSNDLSLNLWTIYQLLLYGATLQ